MARILIIDDEKQVCKMFSLLVRKMGHKAVSACSLNEGLKEVSSRTFDLVLLDIRLPDGNGLEALPKIREAPSSPEVIIITGLGDPDGAQLAIKNGAWDYIEKPSSLEKMTLPITRALQYRAEKKGPHDIKVLKREGIIGDSPLMQSCLDLLAQAAGNKANVLIEGETGTGKELFAQAIHDNSSRAKKDFVVVDCASLPTTLIESTLFGYEKGAFTGADQSHEGLIKQADGGTLFLDEIGELPYSCQKAFLRVLQEHRFRPIGRKREIESDFRLVAATNQNLEELVKQGRFRKDLFFRVRSLTIELPPLRKRVEDIKDIFLYYLPRLSEKYGQKKKGFSPDFFEALHHYEWPGNIREFISALEVGLSALKKDPILYPIHLPAYIRIGLAQKSLADRKEVQMETHQETLDQKRILPLKKVREAAEKQYLRRLLIHTSKNIKKACQLSGLSRSRFYALLKKHNLF
ncbi:MAG: sigma-54-dependent Fis family transcriptional regulator [Deltaproteobacteria bacterium]|nr:sigma-54-dependent Fis family transcriptional regulator [Deltaproteobacteria bacterium]